MGRLFLMVLAFVMLLVLSSGCTQKPAAAGNETTKHEYYNKSNESAGNGNETIRVPSGDFTFKIHGVNEFWLKTNDSIKFYVVFNNKDEDGESHTFIAKAFPSATDFDAMAAYQCLHFITCEPLLSRMRLMVDQPETQILVNYTFVGLYSIGIHIPDNTPKGTYMYNMVACKDAPFSECTETSTNFGPNIPILLHIL